MTDTQAGIRAKRRSVDILWPPRLGRGATMPTVPPITLLSTMIHEVPRGRRKEDNGEGIVLSNSPTPLNPNTDRFIREEMLQPSFASGREIVYVNDMRSPVPQLARDILADVSNLAPHSKEIARHLHASQSGSGSAGVFMASIAESGGVTRLVIMKVEHQEGVQLRHTGTGDDIVFEVEHLQDLILGQNSRVFKIALLWTDPANGRLVGVMVDRQNGVAFADYFLSEFLGFELVHQAEVMTQEFVKGLTTFLNSNLVPEDKKIRYGAAAVAVLESPQTRLNPKAFITQFIEPEDRDVLRAILPHNVATQDFRKDIRLVSSQIGGLKMSTNTGVTLQATQDALSDGTIEVDASDPNDPRIIVRGTPEGFKLSKPPR